MGFEFWYTLLVVGAMTLSLVFEFVKAEIAVFSALLLLLAGNVITLQEAFHGFSNEGMLSVGFLFVAAYAVQASGILESVGRIFLGRQRGTTTAKLFRLLFPVAGLSAFLNNTPLVAMFLPLVKSWCRKNNYSSSKFLIPLSYATVLGGMCTLIGTSTNMVVHGLLLEHGYRGFSFFELGRVGLPVAIVGIILIAFVLQRFLPEKKETLVSIGEKTREFVVAVKVNSAYAEIGKTIEAAGLRHLQGLFLFQIERNGTIIAPVPPTEKIHVNDRLFFTGLPFTIVELQKQRGLDVIQDADFDLKYYDSSELKTYEVVLSESSPLVGQTVRESNFRAEFNAVILAIHRNGERINKKIGDIEFKAGDTLLILAHRDFYNRWYHSKDFLLISTSDEVPSKPKKQAVLSLAIVGAMVVAVAFNLMPMLLASSAAAALLLLTRIINSTEAFQNVEWSTLLLIASSFGVAKGLENSGVAQYFAAGLINFSASYGTFFLLAAVYAAAVLYTELVTNNAAAAMLFPIALAVASQEQLNIMPFVYAVTIGASAGFATPIGYQTHMMVYGPGGYTFKDYLKIGIPLDIVVGIIAVTIIYSLFF
jgi:di/tricarboxylate transporter